MVLWRVRGRRSGLLLRESQRSARSHERALWSWNGALPSLTRRLVANECRGRRVTTQRAAPAVADDVGKRFARWIAMHLGSHLVCTVSRYGRQYWLVDDVT